MSVTVGRAYEIFEGVETPVEETLTLLGTGTTGDPDAKRVLTHPDSENWPPIPYQRNPDKTSFLDNDILYPPKTAAVETEDTTGVIRHESNLSDKVIEEIWFGGDKRASVETWFFRLLYEYLLNPPEIDYSSQTYITWQPRDKNTYTYNLVLMSLNAGGEGQMWVTDLVPQQGDIGGGMQDSDVPGSGVLLEEMRLRFKIVSKVT